MKTIKTVHASPGLHPAPYSFHCATTKNYLTTLPLIKAIARRFPRRSTATVCNSDLHAAASTDDLPTKGELYTQYKAAKLHGAANHADFRIMEFSGSNRKEAMFPTSLGALLVHNIWGSSSSRASLREPESEGRRHIKRVQWCLAILHRFQGGGVLGA